MNLELRKRADREAMAYRENLAYIKGVQDGMDTPGLAHTNLSRGYHDRVRWVWAVDRVRERLAQYEPLMEDFFVRYYALDGDARTHPTKLTSLAGTPVRPHRKGENMIRTAAEMHIGVSTLYKWREHVLDQLVLAATQAGALEPFLK